MQGVITKAYEYSWNLPKGKMRFKGIAHGRTWKEAKAIERRLHPKRKNIAREDWN